MSLMDELKTEISRLARKEIKRELESVKRINATQRGLIANLRRDVADLRKEINQLRREAAKADAGGPSQEEDKGRFWISGKGVLSLRKRLGITQGELATLADVSTQTVVKWEASEGKLSFRSEQTGKNLQRVRSMGKREVKELLD